MIWRNIVVLLAVIWVGCIVPAQAETTAFIGYYNPSSSWVRDLAGNGFCLGAEEDLTQLGKRTTLLISAALYQCSGRVSVLTIPVSTKLTQVPVLFSVRSYEPSGRAYGKVGIGAMAAKWSASALGESTGQHEITFAYQAAIGVTIKQRARAEVRYIDGGTSRNGVCFDVGVQF